MWRVVEAITGELELRTLLTTIVRHACELLAAKQGVIGLVERERQVIRTETVFNTPENELGYESRTGVDLAGRVMEQQAPVVLDRYGDLDQPTRPEILDDAVVGISIFWREEMIGFFGVSAPPPRRFGRADVETLELLARHAAVAIHNARQFETEERRLVRVTAVSRIGQLITSSLSLEDTLSTAVTAVRDLLG